MKVKLNGHTHSITATGMDRWSGKTALVTGASSGIGLATAERLATLGINVIGCARNITTIQELSHRLPPGAGSVTAVRCDVTNESDILRMYGEFEASHQAIHILINNAGLANSDDLLTGDTDKWREMINTNVIGLSICARETLRLMDKYDVRDGHIINMNSLSGHQINNYNAIHFYAATKHMVTALTEGLRREVAAKVGSRIRITSLSPGATLTDFANRWLGAEAVQNTPYVKEGFTFLQSEDIADAVVYILGTPAHVCVHELIIVPTEQKNM